MNLIKRILHPSLEPNELAWITANKSVIDEVIKRIDLKLNIGAKPENFHLEPDRVFYRKPINQKAEIMCNKIGLSNKPTINMGHIHPGRGGEFKRMPGVAFDLNTKNIESTQDSKSFVINISEKYSRNARIASAVLAHEITHFYLYQHRLMDFINADRKMEEMKEESICETVTFLIGLGKIYLNGLYGSGLMPRLPLYIFIYIYERINFIKGIPPKISRKNLEANIKKIILRMSNHQELIES